MSRSDRHPAGPPNRPTGGGSLARGEAPDLRYWDRIASVSAPRGGALWRRHADAINAELIDRWWPRSPVARALKTDLFDEASGTGLLPGLVHRVGRVYGLDAAGPVARQARHRLSQAVPLVISDVRRLPFPTGWFDLVISNSTLDHFQRLAELRTALDEIRRVTAPGGRLILTLDNPMNPAVAVRNALPFRWLESSGLVPYYVGATVGQRRGRTLLTDAGFVVQDTTAVLHCPRVLAVRSAAKRERMDPDADHARFLARLLSWERLGRLPTRFVTGCFVAWLAEVPGAVRQRPGATER